MELVNRTIGLQLLQYIGHTSPECLEDPEVPRNVPSMNSPLNSEMEQETISTILNQKCVENEYLSHAANLSPSVPMMLCSWTVRNENMARE